MKEKKTERKIYNLALVVMLVLGLIPLLFASQSIVSATEENWTVSSESEWGNTTGSSSQTTTSGGVLKLSQYAVWSDWAVTWSDATAYNTPSTSYVTVTTVGTVSGSMWKWTTEIMVVDGAPAGTKTYVWLNDRGNFTESTSYESHSWEDIPNPSGKPIQLKTTNSSWSAWTRNNYIYEKHITGYEYYSSGSWTSVWHYLGENILSFDNIEMSIGSIGGGLKVKVSSSDDGSTIKDNSAWLSITSTGTVTKDLSGITAGKYVRVEFELTKGSTPEVNSFTVNTTASFPPNTPTNLKCENQTSPQRLTTFTPEFSFLYTDNDGDNMQTFQIQVGTSAGDNSMWDKTTTENAENNTTVTITYVGSTLARGTQYWWRAKVQDNYDNWGGWSDNENFQINQLPTCSITAPSDGHDAAVNESISFESSASDADGDLLNYSWDFGDGTTSTNENQNHQYSSSGDYTVTLIVNDGYEDSAAASIVVNITGDGDGGGAGGGGGGGGGPSGWVEQAAEEIDKIVQPSKNPLFTMRVIGIPIFFPLVLVGVITWTHKNRKGIHTMRWSISISIFMIVGFGLVMGAKIG